MSLPTIPDKTARFTSQQSKNTTRLAKRSNGRQLHGIKFTAEQVIRGLSDDIAYENIIEVVKAYETNHAVELINANRPGTQPQLTKDCLQRRCRVAIENIGLRPIDKDTPGPDLPVPKPQTTATPSSRNSRKRANPPSQGGPVKKPPPSPAPSARGTSQADMEKATEMKLQADSLRDDNLFTHQPELDKLQRRFDGKEERGEESSSEELQKLKEARHRVNQNEREAASLIRQVDRMVGRSGKSYQVGMAR